MWDELAPNTENAQFDATDFEAAHGSFIDDMEVVDGLRAETEALEDLDVLARTSDGKDGHGELELTGKEKWKLADGHCRTDVLRRCVWCEEGSTLRLG